MKKFLMLLMAFLFLSNGFSTVTAISCDDVAAISRVDEQIYKIVFKDGYSWIASFYQYGLERPVCLVSRYDKDGMLMDTQEYGIAFIRVFSDLYYSILELKTKLNPS